MMKRKIAIRIAICICIILCSANAFSQSASFNSVWIEHNTYEYTQVNNPVWNGFMWINNPQNVGVKGMKIHIDVDVFNAQGQNLTVAAFVYDEDGDPMRSSNARFRTPDGQLTSQYRFRAEYESTSFPTGWIFIPYSAFSYSGSSADCKVIVQILDRNGYSLGDSDWQYFTISR